MARHTKRCPSLAIFRARGFRCRRKHRTLSSHFDRLRSDRRRYSICHPVSRNISDWWIGIVAGNLRKSDTPQRVDVGCLPYGYPVAYLASTERRVRSVPVPSPPSLPELSLSLSCVVVFFAAFFTGAVFAADFFAATGAPAFFAASSLRMPPSLLARAFASGTQLAFRFDGFRRGWLMTATRLSL